MENYPYSKELQRETGGWLLEIMRRFAAERKEALW
jgi:hypothetical protein